jgi:hypothetical protein
MVDNLSKMIFDTRETGDASNADLMLSIEKVIDVDSQTTPGVTVTATQVKVPKTKSKMTYEYTTIPFPEWFAKHCGIFNDDILRHVKLSCRGLDTRETMAFLVPHPDGGLVNGEPKKKLVTKENADRHFIPDIVPESMEFFTNENFRIVALTRDNIYLTVYVQKAQTFYTYSQKIEDLLIPYTIIKVGKKVPGINVETTRLNLVEKLTQPVNVEDLILLYPQFLKIHESIVTKMDAVKWFIERKSTIFDIHHLLQIDNIILLILR